MRLNSLVVVVIVLAFDVGNACSSQAMSAPSIPVTGVVVDQLNEGFEGVKAGIRKGDILLWWSRGGAKQPMISPFELLYLRYEEAARGKVKLEGFRAGRRKIWLLGSGPWGISSRPNLRGSLLLKYKECEALTKATELASVKRCWQASIDQSQNMSENWIVPWLLFKEAQQLAQFEQWSESDLLYQQAVIAASSCSPKVKGELFLRWGWSFHNRDALDEAEQRYEEALREWRQIGKATISISAPLLEIGAVAKSRGDFSRSHAAWDEALKVELVSAPHSLEAALAYNNLAVLYQDEGDLTKAQDYFQRAVRIEKTYLAGSPYIPEQLANLGTLARDRGDLQSAEAYLNEALALATKPVSENLLVADIFGYFADCLLDRNDLRAAERYQRRALAIRQKLLPRSLVVASNLNSLAFITERNNELGKSEAYYERARSIFEKAAPQSQGMAGSILGLGAVFEKKGQTGVAERYFRQALDLLLRIAPASQQTEQARAALAMNLRLQGDLRGAANLYDQAIQEFEKTSIQLVSFEDTRTRYRAKHAELYHEYVDLLVQMGQAGLAVEKLEHSRARTLVEMLSLYGIDPLMGADPELRRKQDVLLQALKGKMQYRMRLNGSTPAPPEIAGLDREISKLRTQYQETGMELQASRPAYSALTNLEPLKTNAIQKLLEPDMLLIEYALGDDQSHVFVVGPDSVEVHSLPGRSEIERLAYRFHKWLMRSGHSSGIAQREGGPICPDKKDCYAQAPVDLSAAILGPFASILGKKRLLIVADGALLYVPFAALPVPQGVEINSLKSESHNVITEKQATPIRFLVEEHEITNLPAASVIAELRKRGKEQAKALQTAAVFADPVFSFTDERVLNRLHDPKKLDIANSSLRGPVRFNSGLARASRDYYGNGGFHLGRLLYTHLEADAIITASLPGKSVKFINFDATRRAALDPRMAHYQIIHFATHGFRDRAHPEYSGLVLSLVDKNGKAQDGFLQLEDVYNLRLPSAELVVLSGCDTALGEEASSEGLIGLTRGFMYAGAKRVVASLWSVSDSATSELMAQFYNGILKQQMRPAASLRDAQVKMLKQRRWSSPYYWAAFQIQGEWN